MFYIHQTRCISPQQTFLNTDINFLNESVDNKMQVIEPSYEDIPSNILRRMGKAVRIGVGAALPLIQQVPVDGIIIGTADGGMEDCIKFLNQIINYEEGILTPGNFVQSTPNAIASQLGLLSRNKGYNITHVHRGLAFENAIVDAEMLINENPANSYLLGGVDEISAYNYNIDYLGGWFKVSPFSSKNLYTTNTKGSMAGEGSAMFLVNGIKTSAIAQLQAITTLHSEKEETIASRLQYFMDKHLQNGEKIDLFLSGENGDHRFLKYYLSCEAMMDSNITVARFKHMSGEYATASAIALWLGCQIIQNQVLPLHMVKRRSIHSEFKKILVYNNYKGIQHSFILLSKG